MVRFGGQVRTAGEVETLEGDGRTLRAWRRGRAVAAAATEEVVVVAAGVGDAERGASGGAGYGFCGRIAGWW